MPLNPHHHRKKRWLALLVLTGVAVGGVMQRRCQPAEKIGREVAKEPHSQMWKTKASVDHAASTTKAKEPIQLNPELDVQRLEKLRDMGMLRTGETLDQAKQRLLDDVGNSEASDVVRSYAIWTLGGVWGGEEWLRDMLGAYTKPQETSGVRGTRPLGP